MNDLSTAERLKNLHAAGFSQQKIADECGLTQPTVCDYVNGHLKNAKEDVAKRVRLAYDRLMAPAQAA